LPDVLSVAAPGAAFDQELGIVTTAIAEVVSRVDVPGEEPDEVLESRVWPTMTAVSTSSGRSRTTATQLVSGCDVQAVVDVHRRRCVELRGHELPRAERAVGG
jgi:hypothetical protein